MTPSQVKLRSKFLKDEAEAEMAKVLKELADVLCSGLRESARRDARLTAEARIQEIQANLWEALEPLAEHLLDLTVEGKPKRGRPVSREYPWETSNQRQRRQWQEHLLNGKEERLHIGGSPVERRDGVWRQRRTA